MQSGMIYIYLLVFPGPIYMQFGLVNNFQIFSVAIGLT
jgi:hypothetical protein